LKTGGFSSVRGLTAEKSWLPFGPGSKRGAAPYRLLGCAIRGENCKRRRSTAGCLLRGVRCFASGSARRVSARSRNTSKAEREGRKLPCGVVLQSGAKKRQAARSVLKKPTLLVGSFSAPAMWRAPESTKKQRFLGVFMRFLLLQGGVWSSPQCTPARLSLGGASLCTPARLSLGFVASSRIDQETAVFWRFYAFFCCCRVESGAHHMAGAEKDPTEKVPCGRFFCGRQKCENASLYGLGVDATVTRGW